jgi:hypothetical protein
MRCWYSFTAISVPWHFANPHFLNEKVDQSVLDYSCRQVVSIRKFGKPRVRRWAILSEFSFFNSSLSATISQAGPGGAIVAWSAIGILVYAVSQAMGEMATAVS